MPLNQTSPVKELDAESAQLLRSCGELALAQFTRAATVMFDNADASLFELAEHCFDRVQYNQFLEARALAKTQRDFVLNSFQQSFWRAFEDKLAHPAEPKQSFGLLQVDSQALSLVANDEVEETLVVSQLAKTLEGQGGAALSDFQARLRNVLPMEESSQPLLSPLMVLKAFQHAMDKVETSLPIKKIFFQQFQQALQQQLTPVYQDLNQKLESAHIPVRPVRLYATPVQKPSAPLAQAPIPQALSPESSKIQEQGAKSAADSSGMSFDLSSFVGSPSVFAQLEAISQAAPNGLLQEPTVHSLLSQNHERLILDMVGLLFDYVMDNPDVPASLKACCARLQLPALKIALQDEHGFSEKQHPVRLCLDALILLGKGIGAQRYSESLLDEVVTALQTLPQTVEDFSVLARTLRQWQAREEVVAKEREEAAEKQRFEAEHKALCKLAAHRALHKHLSEYRAPFDLQKMIVKWWGRFLMEAFAAGGATGIHWRMGLNTLDLLLMSIQPRKTAQERQALAKELPSVLQKVELVFRKYPEEQAEKQRFLDALLQLHSRLLKPESNEGSVPVAVIQAAPNATMVNTYQADRTEEAPVEESPAADMLDAVVRGSWVEFVDKAGHTQLMKLAWASPMRGMFLFTNQFGQNAINIEADDLRLQFMQGRAILRKS